MQSIDAIKNLAKRVFGTSTDTEAMRGEGYQRPVTPEMETYDKEARRTDRRTKILQCKKMAAEDARVARLLYKLSSDAEVGKFTITVEEAQTDAIKGKAQQVIDQTIKACKVHRKTKGWIKACLREGDLFWEVLVDDRKREIVRLKKLATIITFSNENSEGNFPKDKPAYYQEHPWTRQQVKTFEGWQICHVRWQYEDGNPYGDPMFAPARVAYGRLDKGELNIVIRRNVRAGSKLHHQIGTPEKPSTWPEVEKYKDENKETLANPLSAVHDFFSNGRVTISEIGGDKTVGDIEDLQHLEGQVVLVSGTPYALLGGGREKNVNRDVLKEQEEDYFRVIADINETVEHGLRQVLDFALLLASINDESIKYTFKWGAKDRDTTDARIARGKDMQQLGFSFETIFNACSVEGVTYEEELERIQAQIEQGFIPYGLGARLDPNLVMFLMGKASEGGEKPESLAEGLEKLRSVAEEYLND